MGIGKSRRCTLESERASLVRAPSLSQVAKHPLLLDSSDNCAWIQGLKERRTGTPIDFYLSSEGIKRIHICIARFTECDDRRSWLQSCGASRESGRKRRLGLATLEGLNGLRTLRRTCTSCWTSMSTYIVLYNQYWIL